jgi:hypothetical protein
MTNSGPILPSLGIGPLLFLRGCYMSAWFEHTIPDYGFDPTPIYDSMTEPNVESVVVGPSPANGDEDSDTGTGTGELAIPAYSPDVQSLE